MSSEYKTVYVRPPLSWRDLLQVIGAIICQKVGKGVRDSVHIIKKTSKLKYSKLEKLIATTDLI